MDAQVRTAARPPYRDSPGSVREAAHRIYGELDMWLHQDLLKWRHGNDCGAVMEVGIRELRDHLSRYLEGVQAGQEVIVTDRGRAVARVVAMSGERTIDRLIAEGVVTPSKQPTRKRPRPLKTAGPVSDLVVEQRR